MTNTKSVLTAERLRELLSYDPESGVFTWRVPRKRIHVGKVAGSLDDRGYRQIGIDGVYYRVHRLVWLYVHGIWPVECIDHKNGVLDDNRIANLREATRTQNQGNKRRRCDNRSGFKGVFRNHDKWRAQITINGVSRKLGLFDTPESAHAAYMAAAIKHFGEFANDGVEIV